MMPMVYITGSRNTTTTGNDLNKEGHNMAWRIAHTFPGVYTWQELNEMIRFDSGVQEPYFANEEDYIKAVKDGWVRFDDNKTTIYIDD